MSTTSAPELLRLHSTTKNLQNGYLRTEGHNLQFTQLPSCPVIHTHMGLVCLFLHAFMTVTLESSQQEQHMQVPETIMHPDI